MSTKKSSGLYRLGTHLAVTTALCGAIVLNTPDTAHAEDGERGAFVLDTITVTARKRAESLQDTPIAITALTSEALEVRGVQRLDDIANIAPNVTFSFGGTSSGSTSAAVVYIRGVGQNDFTPVTDPAVGIYVDDVYYGRTIGAALDVLDFERVEVLRGPQGTLFGRNTNAGAINITTKDPGLESAGRIKVLAGEENRYETFVSLSGPVTDKLSLGFSGVVRQRDGYVERVFDGVKLGDDNMFAGRIKANYEASSTLQLKFTADYTREREESSPDVTTNISTGPGSFAFLFNQGLSPINAGDMACADGNGGPLNNPNCANDQFVLGPFKSAETGRSGNDVETWGLSLVALWDASETISVKSVTAYREIDALFSRPTDGTPFDIFQTNDDFGQWQFTQELQLNGLTMDGRLSWVGGVFYMHEEAFDRGHIIANVFNRMIGGATDNDNWAIFGEVSYDITERLHLTGGARYTDETKRYTPEVFNIAALPDPSVCTIVCPKGVTPASFVIVPEQLSLGFDEATWRGSVVYDVSEDINAYATVSKGFKSGGFDLRLPAPLAPERFKNGVPTFLPETLIMYEVGFKTNFPQAGLRLNVSAFWEELEDAQISANPSDSVGTLTANAAEVRIRGVEAEFTWVPTANFIVEGALGFQDAEYTQLDEGVGATGITMNDDIIRTPKWSWNMGASYNIPLANVGSLTPRLDWIYKSRHEFEPANDLFVSEDGFHLLNASVAWSDAAEVWRATFGVNNLTDERYLVAGDSNGAIGYALATFARARNWFVSVERVF